MANPITRTAELKFLLKHSAIYGVGNALSQGVAFLLLPLYTRYLTVSDYGILELIDTTTGLIGIVVGLGVALALSRFYYECDDEHGRRRLVSTVYLLVAAGATILVVLASLVAPLLAVLVLDGAERAYYFRIAFAGLLAGVFVDVGQAYLRMLYKSTLFIAISLFSLCAAVSLNVFFIVHMHLGVLGVLYTSLLVRLMVAIPLTATILGRNGLGFSTRDAKRLLHYSVPLLPPSFGVAFMNYSDRYFIRHFASIADAGIYGLANKFGRSLHMIVTSPFLMTFMPRRFQLAKERPDAPQVFRIVFDCFFLGILFLSLSLSVFMREIMIVMTTPDFYRAGALVPLVLVNMLLFGVRYHVDFGVLNSGKTQYYMHISIVAAAVQFVSLFFLVRAFGVWGGVFAGLISMTTYTVLLYVVSTRLYPIPFNLLRSAKLFALAVLVYVMSQQIAFAHWPVAVLVKLLLLGGFVVALPLLGLVSTGELTQLRQLLSSYSQREGTSAPAPTAS